MINIKIYHIFMYFSLFYYIFKIEKSKIKKNFIKFNLYLDFLILAILFDNNSRVYLLKKKY
jgi:hypothetical protein